MNIALKRILQNCICPGFRGYVMMCMNARTYYMRFILVFVSVNIYIYSSEAFLIRLSRLKLETYVCLMRYIFVYGIDIK